jgi:hypothetical protein
MDTLAQALHRIEAHAKVEVAREFIKRSYGALSPANAQHWNRDGYYTARQPSELEVHGFVAPPIERAFEVPVECPYWGAPFMEGEQVFRGFLRHAWLRLPEGDPTAVVALPVYGASSGIYASVDGVDLDPLAVAANEAGMVRWRLGAADPLAVLHLRSDAPVVRFAQHGRISCFVGKPFWSR